MDSFNLVPGRLLGEDGTSTNTCRPVVFALESSRYVKVNGRTDLDSVMKTRCIKIIYRNGKLSRRMAGIIALIRAVSSFLTLCSMILIACEAP